MNINISSLNGYGCGAALLYDFNKLLIWLKGIPEAQIYKCKMTRKPGHMYNANINVAVETFFFLSTRKIFHGHSDDRKTTITMENLLALWTSCGEILKPNQVEPHLLCPYGTDHLQSSSKASLLARLIEEREEQLGTHAYKLQTHIPVYQHSSEYTL